MLPKKVAEQLVTVRPPLIAGALLLISLLLHYVVPFWDFFNLRVLDVGIIFVAAGFILIAWAFILNKHHGNDILPTAPKASALLTTGPYTFTRNPMYLGMSIMLLGIAFIFGTLPFFFAAGIFYFILNVAHIPFEEFKLEKQFGDSYRVYLRRTRRWI